MYKISKGSDIWIKKKNIEEMQNMDGIAMIQDLHFRYMMGVDNIFHASLLIRHASDGRMYLYDIIDIKKKRATPLVYKHLLDKKPISYVLIVKVF